MKERPILFSGPMVRAILDGTKTQTRRVAKFFDCDVAMQFPPRREDGWWKAASAGYECRCPYGEPGDRLWVRETFAPMIGGGWVYAAEYTHSRLAEKDGHGFWKPSIFMPRPASRLTLEITRIRVERLQEITEADAIAEGIRHDPHLDGYCYDTEGRGFHVSSAVRAYENLWHSINGPASWEANPWVWVLEFTTLRDQSRVSGPPLSDRSRTGRQSPPRVRTAGAKSFRP